MWRKRDRILFYIKYFVWKSQKGLSDKVIFEQRPKKVQEQATRLSARPRPGTGSPDGGTLGVLRVSKEAGYGSRA